MIRNRLPTATEVRTLLTRPEELFDRRAGRLSPAPALAGLLVSGAAWLVTLGLAGVVVVLLLPESVPGVARDVSQDATALVASVVIAGGVLVCLAVPSLALAVAVGGTLVTEVTSGAGRRVSRRAGVAVAAWSTAPLLAALSAAVAVFGVAWVCWAAAVAAGSSIAPASRLLLLSTAAVAVLAPLWGILWSSYVAYHAPGALGDPSVRWSRTARLGVAVAVTGAHVLVPVGVVLSVSTVT